MDKSAVAVPGHSGNGADRRDKRIAQRAVSATPLLIQMLDLSYTSLSPLSVVALAALILMGQPARAAFFIKAFFVTAVLATVMGFWLPAQGSVLTLVGAGAGFDAFPSVPGVYFVNHLAALREPTGDILLDPLSLPGLVTFPSFHTTACCILMVAIWRTWAFWPVLAYAAVMIASTPVFGGHSLVDLPAGALLAWLGTALVKGPSRNRAMDAASGYW